MARRDFSKAARKKKTYFFFFSFFDVTKTQNTTSRTLNPMADGGLQSTEARLQDVRDEMYALNERLRALKAEETVLEARAQAQRQEVRGGVSVV